MSGPTQARPGGPVWAMLVALPALLPCVTVAQPDAAVAEAGEPQWVSWPSALTLGELGAHGIAFGSSSRYLSFSGRKLEGQSTDAQIALGPSVDLVWSSRATTLTGRSGNQVASRASEFGVLACDRGAGLLDSHYGVLLSQSEINAQGRTTEGDAGITLAPITAYRLQGVRTRVHLHRQSHVCAGYAYVRGGSGEGHVVSMGLGGSERQEHRTQVNWSVVAHLESGFGQTWLVPELKAEVSHCIGNALRASAWVCGAPAGAPAVGDAFGDVGAVIVLRSLQGSPMVSTAQTSALGYVGVGITYHKSF